MRRRRVKNRPREKRRGAGQGANSLLPGLSRLDEALRESLGDADALLIVPPFAGLRHPSLAVHLLQACCRQAGFRVDVLYANFLLAALLGESTYTRICQAPMGSFAAERFFARAAFGGRPLGRRARRMLDPPWEIPSEEVFDLEPDSAADDSLTVTELLRLEGQAGEFAQAVARAIARRSYAVVGCTTIFEQTAASVAILNRVKRLNPGITTVLGGANCEGEMSRGLAALDTRVDYFFSGESEATFPAFLRSARDGSLPEGPIVEGRMCRDLDSLPTPVYSEFFEQRRRFLPARSTPEAETEILYETSRGCWWGEKHQCTFCGLNGEGMAFRKKSPERVV
ncbi:MAG: hypothetical protein KGL59_16375, partial [Acidobacteriota bacterium]|nr:hypothetical protein [Acidobacteriota bacterium]